MSILKRCLIVAAVIAGLIAPAGEAEAAIESRIVECGERILVSVRLLNDLDCTGHGLEIGRSGITIDLNGHLISGDGGADDRGIAPPFLCINSCPNFTVRNGSIAGFGVGVEVFGVFSTDIQVTGLTLTRNQDGISLIRADGTEVRGNTIFGNTRDGIVASDGGSPVIAGNQVSGNGDDGIDLSTCSAGTSVKSNRVSLNGGDGVILTDCDEMSIQKNSLRQNRFSGLVLDGVENAVVKENVFAGNLSNGLFLHSDATGVRVRDNKANGNGLHGINTDAPDTKVTGNVAKENGFRNGPNPDGDDNGLGIEAPPTVPGGSNIARGNDDPRQCDPTRLC